MFRSYLFSLFLVLSASMSLFAQNITWSADGRHMFQEVEGQLFRTDLSTGARTSFVSLGKLRPAPGKEPLELDGFSFSQDQQWMLIFTNTARVWRYNTRGDYWLLHLPSGKLRQLGKGRPSQTLMFAKLSPDGTKVAYVSEKNIYVEEVASGVVKPLTTSGRGKMINGTFDWVYEEEFSLRDGFRWGPDSKQIAYWQVDANGTRDFYMMNNTDSVYSRIVPVEYPKVGQPISKVRAGVVNVQTGQTKWMNIPGEADQHYLVRLEWAARADEVIVQQLDRRQQESKLFLCAAGTGTAKQIYGEKDEAWIDIQSAWDDDYANGGWDWLEKGTRFLWASEKDGWRHLYLVDRGGREQLLTKGDYDVMNIVRVDEASGFVYFMASPNDATSTYLYRVKLNGEGKAERLSPGEQNGAHGYDIAPGAKIAYHSFSNYFTPYVTELITLPDHKGWMGQSVISAAVSRAKADSARSLVSFIKVKTIDGVEMDAWMQKPFNFDPAKKYPVVFHVYSEPASQTVKNRYGIEDNRLYVGDMAADGYIYISMDNRGTPAAKGREWRKSIYRKIGIVNIRDQAMGAKEILKWPYVDSSRVAVWGWSGGGSATLNLLFQYPEIYKTGISIAAVANQLTYDNIYQERYMGSPFESTDAYVKGSPITYAKNLRGKLLYIHGTGDDNVHYQNADMLVNELVKYNKQFQFMPYPNRSHGIYEGAGTSIHLKTLFTNFLKEYCPPGGK